MKTTLKKLSLIFFISLMLLAYPLYSRAEEESFTQTKDIQIIGNPYEFGDYYDEYRDDEYKIINVSVCDIKERLLKGEPICFGTKLTSRTIKAEWITNALKKEYNVEKIDINNAIITGDLDFHIKDNLVNIDKSGMDVDKIMNQKDRGVEKSFMISTSINIENCQLQGNLMAGYDKNLNCFVLFDKPVTFYSSTVVKKTNFWNAIFNGETNFKYARFNGEVDFRSARFNDDSVFEVAIFKYKAYFESASFQKKANFMYASFNEKTHFWNTRFNGETNFRNTIFNGETNFRTARFKKNVYFIYAGFNSKVDFTLDRFIGEADFTLASFNDEVNFESASFYDATDFRNAIFNGETNFGSASFYDVTGFTNAIFNGKTSFKNAIFNGKANFGSAYFFGGQTP